MELKNNLVIDFDTFSGALTDILLEDSTSFKSIYPGATANILVEALSGYAAMLMYRLQTAISNSFLKSAFSEYSIFSIAEMLGVVIRGNTGSTVDVILSRKPFTGVTTLPEFTIPAYTGFTINNYVFYNREPIVFPQDYVNVSTSLHQGEIKTQEFTTTGAFNEKFEFGDSFTTDIDYVKVYVNGVEWATDYETIMDYTVGEEYSLEDVRCVLLRTNVDGTCYIQFGNGVYGILPEANSIVKVVYASTSGSSGNFTGASDITINDNLTFGDEILEIYSTNIGAATGGTDKLSSESLKYISPRLFASNNRAVKRSDYIGQLIYNCNYLDCNFWGEYEEAERNGYANNTMMNKAYYTAITNSFSLKDVTFGTGAIDETGELIKDFSGNVSSTIMFPGSVEISSETETFRDFSGLGYMLNESSNYTIHKSVPFFETDEEGKYVKDEEGNYIRLEETVLKTDSVGHYWKLTASTKNIEKESPEDKESTITNPLGASVLNVSLLGDSPKFTSSFTIESEGVTYTVVFDEEESVDISGDDFNQYWHHISFTFIDNVDGEEVSFLYKGYLQFHTKNEYSNPIDNVLITLDDDFNMNNANVFYQSSRNPTSVNPIIIEFRLPTDKVLAGVRFYSSSYATSEDRCFPSKVLIVASRNEPTKFADLDDYLSEDEENRWTFSEMMQDTSWTKLSECNNIPDPGPSTWSEWCAVDTTNNYEKVVRYIKQTLTTVYLENKFTVYRICILDKHGDADQENIKLGKIAFLCKDLASTINYETGDARVIFDEAPLEDTEITASSIGDKLSDYQKLRDYSFIRNINHFTTELNYKELHLKRVSLDVTVIYKSSVELSTLKSNVETAINEMFEVTQGRIGQSLRISTIYQIIMNIDGVSYCTKKLPISDIECNVNEILYLSDLNIEYVSASRLG